MLLTEELLLLLFQKRLQCAFDFLARFPLGPAMPGIPDRPCRFHSEIAEWNIETNKFTMQRVGLCERDAMPGLRHWLRRDTCSCVDGRRQHQTHAILCGCDLLIGGYGHTAAHKRQGDRPRPHG